MRLRSGARREGEGRPHFGVKQCESDILPTRLHCSRWLQSPQTAEKPHTDLRHQLHRHLAQPLVPTERETHQTGFINSPLPASVCFVVQGCCFLCSVRSADLAWPPPWWQLHPPWCAAAHGERVPWAGDMVWLAPRWSDAVTLVRITAHTRINSLSWWCPRSSWEWTSERSAHFDCRLNEHSDSSQFLKAEKCLFPYNVKML